MQNVLFQTICRVGIFMICAQAMIHFRPQEAYEKYLKFLVSIMVLIQLFLPVGSFLLGGGGQQAVDMLEQFRGELEQSMADAERKAAEAETVLEQMTLEELRRRLEEQNRQDGEDKEAGEAEGQAGGRREGEMGNEERAEDTREAEGRAGDQIEGGTGGAEGGPQNQGTQGLGEGGEDQSRRGGYGADGIEIGVVEVEPVAPVTIEGMSP